MTQSAYSPARYSYNNRRALVAFEPRTRYLRHINKKSVKSAKAKSAKAKMAYVAPGAEVALFPNILEQAIAGDLKGNQDSPAEFKIKVVSFKRIKDLIYRNNDTYNLYGVTDAEMYTEVVDIQIGDVSQSCFDKEEISTNTSLVKLVRVHFDRFQTRSKRFSKMLNRKRSVFREKFREFASRIGQMGIKSDRAAG